MMTVTAHLNGGPRDDDLLAVQNVEIFVVGMVRPVFVTEPVELFGPSFKQGRYVMRLDGNGQPVPHNLDGAIEYDWEGWK